MCTTCTTTCTTPRDQENNKHDKYRQMRIARQEMQIGISRTQQESRRVLQNMARIQVNCDKEANVVDQQMKWKKLNKSTGEFIVSEGQSNESRPS